MNKLNFQKSGHLKIKKQLPCKVFMKKIKIQKYYMVEIIYIFLKIMA